MSEAWINFGVIVFVQLILFIIHAYYEKRLSEAAAILGRGVLSGIILGLLFDLIFGKFFGLWSYSLGFDAFFLILNASLLYGLFAANTLLMQKAGLVHFYVWTMIVAVVFEITNLFFPAWAWAFELPEIVSLIVISAGNLGAAILVAVVWHRYLGYRFSFIEPHS